MARLASKRTDAWRPVWSETLAIGMQVPAGLREQGNDPHHLVLIRPAATAAEFEALQVSRHRERGGDTAEGWNRALAQMAAVGQWRDVLLSPLQPYPIADYDGTLSLLRFTDGGGVGTVAALWCGQVGRETVTLLYRCGLDREAAFSATVTPRSRIVRWGERSRSGEASPAVIFGLSLVIAVVLILVGIMIQTG